MLSPVPEVRVIPTARVTPAARFELFISMALLVLGLGCLAPALADDSAAEHLADLPPDLRESLEAMDRRLAHVHSLQADFIKAHYTPLLRKPMISRGRVRMTDGLVRWDTLEPRVSHTLLRDNEVQILYPDDKRMEVYPLDERFSQFGVGPLPRMAELAERLSIERIEPDDLLADDPANDKPGSAPAPRYIALRMTPKAQALREQVDRVDVLVDTKVGYIRTLRIVQPDGTRTVYTFQDAELNPDLSRSSLELEPPPGTRVVRPYNNDKQ